MISRNKIMSLALISTLLVSSFPPLVVNATDDSLLGNTNSNPSTYLNDEGSSTNEEDISKIKYNFSEQTLAKITEGNRLIEIAEKELTDVNVDKAYNYFTNIRFQKKDENYAHFDGDEFDELFLRIIATINKLPVEQRNENLVDFQRKLYKAYKPRKGDNPSAYENIFYKEYCMWVYEAYDVPSINDKLLKIIQDINSPNGIDPEDYDYDGEANFDDGILPGEQPVEDLPPIKDNYIPTENKSVSYDSEGNRCVRVTTFFNDMGEPIKELKEKALKSEYIFCDIYDYIPIGGGLSNYTNAQNTDSLWGYVNTTQNKESNMTIQYSVNKDTEMPYYYDTGIRVSLKNTISFEQLRDVLYQVSIKSGGYFVEDDDKILSIIEGTPIIIKKEKSIYSKEDLNRVFKDFKKVDVRIMETRIGKSSSLEEKILSKQANKIKINGREIQLVTLPTIKDGRVLLPIEQIAKELGAIFTISNGRYVITKGDSMLVYELNKTYVLSNGQAIEMGTSPELKEKVLLGEIQEIANVFKYDIMWDGETNTILLTKK